MALIWSLAALPGYLWISEDEVTARLSGDSAVVNHDPGVDSSADSVADSSHDTADTGPCPDADRDGYTALSCGGNDCDDGNAAVNPAAIEVCNGIDDNCNNIVDDDAVDAGAWYVDADGDGYGVTSTFIVACSPAGYAATFGDCDDTNPAIHPGATETCDGKDGDCDGTVDDNSAGCPCPIQWYGTHAFLFCSSPKDWSSAGSACSTVGYHLASMTSAGENDYVNLTGLTLGGAYWWLGFTDAAVEGTWVWSDGDAVTVQPWEPQEPDDGGGSGAGEDCAVMITSGVWDDVACTAPYPFLSEAG